jgi:O-antigen/teichoic acid export membrane protein
MNLLVLMMLRIQHNGAAELGVFYAAQNIQMAFLFLPILVSTVFFPNLCNVGSMSHQDRYWNVVKKGIILQEIISLTVVLPMILFPNFLLGLCGGDFVGNGFVLIMFGILGVLNVLCTIVWQILVDQKKVWYVALLEFGEIITTTIVAYFLLKNQYGCIGILTALISGRIFILLTMMFYLQRHSKTLVIQHFNQ